MRTERAHMRAAYQRGPAELWSRPEETRARLTLPPGQESELLE
jgi:hypothetical protein